MNTSENEEQLYSQNIRAKSLVYERLDKFLDGDLRALWLAIAREMIRRDEGPLK